MFNNEKAKRLLKELGLSQGQIAREISKRMNRTVCQGTVSRWMTGSQNPRPDVVKILATILQVDTLDLYQSLIETEASTKSENQSLTDEKTTQGDYVTINFQASVPVDTVQEVTGKITKYLLENPGWKTVSFKLSTS